MRSSKEECTSTSSVALTPSLTVTNKDKFIKNNQIDLFEVNLDIESFFKLLTEIKTYNGVITNIDLSGLAITDTAGKSSTKFLLKALADANTKFNIESLDLSDLDLDLSSEYLAMILQNNPNLSILKLNDVITNRDQISSIVGHIKNIKYLGFSDKRLFAPEGQANNFFKLLLQNNCIYLDFSNNHAVIGREEALTIQALIQKKGLIYLDLSNNKVSDGAIDVINSASQNCARFSMLEINAPNNPICLRGFKLSTLIIYLSEKEFGKSFNFYNYIDELTKIVAASNEGEVIIRLSDYVENKIKKEDFTRLDQYFEKNSNIVRFEIDGLYCFDNTKAYIEKEKIAEILPNYAKRLLIVDCNQIIDDTVLNNISKNLLKNIHITEIFLIGDVEYSLSALQALQNTITERNKLGLTCSLIVNDAIVFADQGFRMIKPVEQQEDVSIIGDRSSIVWQSTMFYTILEECVEYPNNNSNSNNNIMLFDSNKFKSKLSKAFQNNDASIIFEQLCSYNKFEIFANDSNISKICQNDNDCIKRLYHNVSTALTELTRITQPQATQGEASKRQKL